MKKEELLKSKEYWMVQVQNDLFGIMEEFMKKNNFNRTELAKEFGVSKGYITQIFNGDFDHKLSKFIELSLASNKAPVINFVDINRFIQNDGDSRTYELISVVKPRNITFETKAGFTQTSSPTQSYPIAKHTQYRVIASANKELVA